MYPVVHILIPGCVYNRYSIGQLLYTCSALERKDYNTRPENKRPHWSDGQSYLFIYSAPPSAQYHTNDKHLSAFICGQC